MKILIPLMNGMLLMTNNNMITIVNKNTGERKTIPRSQYVQEKPSTGFSGIGNDISSSLHSALPALGEMLSSIPGGIKNVAKYATSNNPVETFANLGAGGTESVAGLLSSPQILMRYLAEKFPNAGKRMQQGDVATGGQTINDPTIYEGLKKFENKNGLAPQTEEENSVRNLGGLLFGGKALSKLPSRIARTGAITGEATGRGGDPLHAALLSILGEQSANLFSKGINKAAGRESSSPNNNGGNPPPPGTSAPNFTANIGNMPNNSNGYMTAISNIPQAAVNIAKAIPKAVKTIPEVAGQAVASGLESAADYGSKIPMAGSILQPTVGALASYLKHLSVSPETLAKRKLFSDITSEDLPQINERQAAAKRLGLSFLTPGESLLSPFQSAKEANIGRTSSGSRLLYEKGKGRVGTEGQAIDNLLDTIYDGNKLSAEKQAAYEDAMSSIVPSEFMEKWKKDFVVEKAIKQIQTLPEYKRAARNMPENSFKYWDLVKRVVGDLETEDPRGTKKTKSDQATQARNEMVDEMDTINPRYETARDIASREFTRKDLENVFDKKSMTLNNFWSFLKSDKQFNKLMNKLNEFPEAQQKLKDIRMLSNEMIPFDDSIRTAYKLEKTGMTKERNKLDSLKRDLDERYGKEHDVAAVNLMTDPQWVSKLVEHLKKKGK